MIRITSLTSPALAAAAMFFMVGTAVANETSRRPGPVPVHAIAATIPTLRNAVALGTVVAIDPQAAVAEFRIRCGWYLKPRRKVRIGLWKVPLRGLTFEWESYTPSPTSGVSHTESRGAWVRSTERFGWSGTLHLSRHEPFVTDGPTTDICAGVLG